MNDPDWAKLLKLLYESQGTIFLIDPEGDNEHTYKELYNLLSKEVDFSNKITNHLEASEMIHNMQEVGLIHYNIQPYGIQIKLSEKGFDVAHEREISKSRQKTNRKSTNLSAYLVLGIIAQALSSFLAPNRPWANILYLLVLLGILLLVFTEINREYLERVEQKITAYFRS